MSRDSCWTKTVVKYGFDHGIFAFDVVVYGKREVWHTHAMMPVANRVDSSKLRKVVKRFADTIHEMIQHPLAVRRIEILRFDEIELGKGCKPNVFHFRGQLFGRQGAPLLQTSRKPGVSPRHKASPCEPIRVHAMRGECTRPKMFQETPKDSPLSGLSRRHPFRQLPSLRQACWCFLSSRIIIPKNRDDGMKV